jgi:arsenite methyltransferase
MQRMPYPDASFDAVVASLSIHNISSREGRRKAIQEIVRVLKPGGQVALLDFRCVGHYADDLRAEGMNALHVSWMSFRMFPPVRMVTGVKTR